MTEEQVKLPSKEEILNEETSVSTEESQQEKASTESEPVLTKIEQEALKQGWKPKDKWDGDPEQHRSAREYLDRGELLGKIKSQSQQMHEFRTALQAMSEQNKKVFSAGYEKALSELKQRKLEALEAGDAKTVMQLDDQIDEHKQAIRDIKNAPNQVQMQPSAITMDWLDRNKWYATNKAAKAGTDKLAIDYARDNPGVSEEQLYRYLDDVLPQELPHLFQKKVTSAPDPDQESNKTAKKTTGGVTSFERLLDTMTDEQRSIAKTMVKTGGITKEDYVKQFKQVTEG